MSGAESAFYIGDEETDEDIFRLDRASIFTVRVGKKNSSKAAYFIKTQSEMNAVLEALIKSSG